MKPLRDFPVADAVIAVLLAIDFALLLLLDNMSKVEFVAILSLAGIFWGGPLISRVRR